ncbi:hypothetical protein E3N88_28700 [Mikania micrantha]|uniref:Uncharacterized protein n=1 Tax=Mikania micrantha TaxID=192012 RepID=A0A5N6N085_9ASTR|nr:hypothetical protein E3N88_28700 [Mikania micrantha]
MLSWRSGKARIWGTEGSRFEPHSSHPSEVPAAVDPWANRGSLKDAGIAQIRAVSRGDSSSSRPLVARLAKKLAFFAKGE